MCTYYYLHRHHTPPCDRIIDYVMQYGFCTHATMDPTTGLALPCENLCFDQEQSVDYNNPCAMGGCTESPDCSSGACRLAELNGIWVCCECNRGGNVYRWCGHRMRSSPDTLCYHVCCKNCQPDEASMSLGREAPVANPVSY
ncbi:uncharacterized protein SPSK_08099 [Sporothrix schenckii 1099-18]|uniref:Uncharacterized protein n=2 Tax=Sporothrix schenckii TaxID=29908 RepID=U7PY75_SPOS1|nr:uncharacterized protein SPSK_08099 [Sporothrix schenckii 1099-18]ERT00609.1 hypothetical protein HMPREF1624_01836 [Sporothrix schenckii ATCC 58251]KJR87668.1 hypothetical protein SPSK_08099 [Sporothrix schenckii 1099-18]